MSQGAPYASEVFAGGAAVLDEWPAEILFDVRWPGGRLALAPGGEVPSIPFQGPVFGFCSVTHSGPEACAITLVFEFARFAQAVCRDWLEAFEFEDAECLRLPEEKTSLCLQARLARAPAVRRAGLQPVAAPLPIFARAVEPLDAGCFFSLLADAGWDL